MFLTVGVLAAWDYLKTTKGGETKPSSKIVTTSSDSPSEQKPPPIATSNYTVPDGQPRRIQIPHLKVDTYVEHVGITNARQMATPNNIFFTGWYVNGAVPGAEGVSILNGHAGGRYEEGVFRHLNQLKAGDVIKIQMGNLSWRDFTVVSMKTYPVGRAKGPLFNHDPAIKSELHLITCDGTFNDKTQTYNERTIVVARYDQK